MRRSARVQAILRAQPRHMAALLEQCAAYGAFAAHHAEWLRAHGAPRCAYFRTPVPDEAGPDWHASRERHRSDGPPRILLLGHLRGIVTIDGLRVFARVLPLLDRAFGRDGYVVDVVGGYDPPQELAAMFEHPAVRRHGHAEDAGAWLQRTDVLVVPTSIPLGIRVRIITGLSFGTPIVTHSANALGIPELEDGVNALIGGSPEEIAAQIVRVTRDGALRERLGRQRPGDVRNPLQPAGGGRGDRRGALPVGAAPGQVRMSRVLVTGGAGFIGSHLVEALLQRGDAVTVFDNLSTGERGNVPAEARLVVGDVADAATVLDLAATGFDAVLHVAGQASISRSFDDPGSDLAVNVSGTLNVLRACRECGIPRLVYASSMTVYGEPDVTPTPEAASCRPISYYGVTKYAAECYVQISGALPDVPLAVTSLRMFNVYGERQSLTNPYQGVLAIFLGNVLRGEPITIHSDGRQARDFVYVRDVVAAWLAALDSEAAHGRIFNIGSGRETSIAALADAVLAANGSSRKDWPVCTGEAQRGDQRRSLADISSVERVLGWRPKVSLTDGMERTVAWARQT